MAASLPACRLQQLALRGTRAEQKQGPVFLSKKVQLVTIPLSCGKEFQSLMAVYDKVLYLVHPDASSDGRMDFRRDESRRQTFPCQPCIISHTSGSAIFYQSFHTRDVLLPVIIWVALFWVHDILDQLVIDQNK